MPTPDDTPLLLDAMLGKLATYLRMCGYDAAYALDRELEADDEIERLAVAEDRLLVTRDVTLAERTGDAIAIESRDVVDQLGELADRGFELSLEEPRRCSVCNGILERLGPEASTPSFAPSPSETAVWQCRSCGQPFWKGSHWDDVRATIEDVAGD